MLTWFYNPVLTALVSATRFTLPSLVAAITRDPGVGPISRLLSASQPSV
jgi:hypothetical protein